MPARCGSVSEPFYRRLKMSSAVSVLPTYVYTVIVQNWFQIRSWNWLPVVYSTKNAEVLNAHFILKYVNNYKTAHHLQVFYRLWQVSNTTDISSFSPGSALFRVFSSSTYTLLNKCGQVRLLILLLLKSYVREETPRWLESVEEDLRRLGGYVYDVKET